ncbi:hypothetical protein [Sphingobacterium bambusae]|uniref:Uncharacterized protein n=1 Tax=Sphingobacterium bambusae TaxID=662858 RepID=A0ABW6BDL6_9SPHI|nr:hypothetical protein [Sphingobacterium bambusae]WPL48896.1 hypothetical protein SCB77_00255 [Sphingobacterium bambusae]
MLGIMLSISTPARNKQIHYTKNTAYGVMFNIKAENVLIQAASRYKYEFKVFTPNVKDENAYF